MNYINMIKKELTPRDCLILETLTKGDSSPSKLACDHTSSASITQIIDKMVARGYVKRDRHPSDRRSLVLSITVAGKEAICD